MQREGRQSLCSLTEFVSGEFLQPLSSCETYKMTTYVSINFMLDESTAVFEGQEENERTYFKVMSKEHPYEIAWP